MAPKSLADYLAKNYLNASSSTKSTSASTSNPDFLDSTRPKKKRRKNQDSNNDSGGLLIADDDADLTLRQGGPSRRRPNENGDDDDDLDMPIYTTSAPSAEFRKKKTTSWKAVDSPSTTNPSNPNPNTDDAEAERIISEAAAESAARRHEIDDEDAPAIVDLGPETSQPRMQSGARAGLQTAADSARLEQEEEQRRAQAEAEAVEEKRKSRSKSKKNHDHEDEPPEEEQTIYRDATGRRIDLTLKRAEARRAEVEKLAAEKKAREDAMGDVQRRQKEERRQELDDAKFLTLGRSADDHDMNEQLKTVVRWDDPMAAYMASKRAEDGDDGDGKARNGKGTVAIKGNDRSKTVQKRVYQGSAPPNRYGISPGWRWDGVDRGNGFEKDWFQARGRKARNEDLSYQWQMDE